MKIEKVEKLVHNLHDKTEYVTDLKNLYQALNHGPVLKKVHRVITFNQNTWLKPHINMINYLRKPAKKFEKTLSRIIRFLEKLWTMFENIGTLKLQQPKKELFGVRTKSS